jgi:hypothetical protein
MQREAYEEYVRLITEFRQDPDTILGFNKHLLPENQEEQKIVFVCKNYKIEGGLSHRLHNNQGDLCQIKAVMGKGLGIDTQGTNLAFVAGTGVLVFMDLAAFLLRGNLGLLDKEERHEGFFEANSPFKLVLYVSFDNRRDALGLDLL